MSDDLSLTQWNLLTSASPTFVGPSTFGRLFADATFWTTLSVRASGRWAPSWWSTGWFSAGPGPQLSHPADRPGHGTDVAAVGYAHRGMRLCVGVGRHSQKGYVYAVLHALHIFGPTSPLAAYNSALPMVTVVSGWKGVPFMAVALLAALKSIPAEHYEAARIDGASFLQLHRYITLPAVRTTALVIGMLLGIAAFYSFDFAWLMTNGGPATPPNSPRSICSRRSSMICAGATRPISGWPCSPSWVCCWWCICALPSPPKSEGGVPCAGAGLCLMCSGMWGWACSCSCFSARLSGSIWAR